MKAEILTIGDEILIGQIVNTNSVWIAQQLNLIGIKVAYMASVADDENEIIKSLDAASARAQFVFITGGLGPTKDDITKKTLAKYFNVALEYDNGTLKFLTDYFTRHGKTLSELNRQQALVPQGCFVIPNKQGTAPGMWMKKNGISYISMPGVPYEMKGMMLETILPKIQAENVLPFIYHKTVLTQGLAESTLAEKIENWEDQLATKNIKLAYLPQPGIVRLRLSTSGSNRDRLKENVEDEIEKLRNIIGKYIYGYENYGEENVSLEKIISNLLRERKKTLALAESCSGGYIASLFTSIPGASDIFKGGIVPYTNTAKHEILDVENKVFETVGAVSKECVEQLARNVREKLKADYAISVSGIAGPTGGTPDKPVGTVWIAVADEKEVEAQKFRFGDDRKRNIEMTAQAAMNMLRKFIA